MSKWNYARSIPKNVYVACSGGVDSVAVAAILSEWRNVTLLHFSHQDHAAEHELEVVSNLSHKLQIPLIKEVQTTDQKKGNTEKQWRDARYKWFHSFSTEIVTGHTLDDAVEWYLMTCLRGRGEFIPIENQNVFRPFLFTEKENLKKYLQHRNIEWWEDPTNHDVNFGLRSRVRNQLIPLAMQCQPGLKKMIKRKLIEKYKVQK